MAILSLSACASQPITVPEIIHDKTYIPVPATLTQPVSIILPANVTWGQALGLYNEALQTCGARLAAISTLQPPPPNPHKNP